MKLSTSNTNFKQTLVKHGEKIVVGLIGLFAVFALMKTTWSTYTKTPQQLKEKALQAAETIKKGTWPDSEKEKYPSHDQLALKLKRMQQPISLAQLAPTIDPSFELYLKDKLHEDPSLLPVEALTATYFKMLIAKPLPQEQFVAGGPGNNANGVGANGQVNGATQADKKDRAKRLKINQRPSPMGPGGSGGDGYTPPGLGNSSGSGSGPGGTGPGGYVPPALGNSPMGDIAPGGMGPGMAPPGAGGGTGFGMVTLAEGKGYQTISVTGVFNIAKQAKEFANALNLPSDDVYTIRQYLQMQDAIVERQTSLDNGKTWGQWEKLDLDAYRKFLMEKVADYDMDIVDRMVTDPVITSPLPARLLWSWGPNEASHPMLKNFELTEEGKKLQQKLDELIAKRKKAFAKAQQENLQRRGFAPVQNNLQGAGFEAMNDASSRNQINRELRNMYNPMGEQPEAVRELTAKITAAGNLLLFRFFDITVEPGKTYRYRVKLVVLNPNYRKPIQLLAPEFHDTVTERTKTTPYSNITTPVYVPYTTKYFVDDVNYGKSNVLSLIPPTVNMTIYDWKSNLGTTVKGKLKELRVGQPIQGEDEKTEVLDIAKNSLLDNQKTDFKVDSTVVDISAGSKQLTKELADQLGLSPKEFRDKRLKIQDEVLVIDDQGRLEALNPMEKRQEEIAAEDDWSFFIEQYDHLRNTVQTNGADGSDMGMGSGAGSLEELANPGDQGSGPVGRRGPRRRRRSFQKPQYPQYPGGSYNPMGGAGGYNPYPMGGSGSSGGGKATRRSRRRSSSSGS
ncbi:MAG: hypothetical protein Tsb009_15860 [Planctomycetaceae bacterium]